ncbi:hypothetical protein APHAL10511_003105 [Amanita phalloides]|nr:hypothetical protein APHAL10511_003105 [Amanita phalloides]
MVPVLASSRNAHSSRLLYASVNVVSYYVRHLLHPDSLSEPPSHLLVGRSTRISHKVHDIIFPIFIPVLVLLSGLFAGLTLGYMSLDETQLNVLSISGTSDQRKYANKIKPIRKNGHLLLVTLLLANMIVNESLPVIADPVLGGGVQSVVVSTVLIVIFSEIIPQSLFTRHGLYLGAKMAGFTQFLIYALGIIAWPVAKLLEFVLGSHHGIIYRRAELKELIAMHSAHAAHGGDLKMDTVTIIGATLDLQEKVVKQAMTPIENVFMLSIESKLDFDTMKKICDTGHSRVPVYEEVDIPAYAGSGLTPQSGERMLRVKRILGIFLVKNCVLLDPKDATPLRTIPLNKVPFVPNNEPLLHILDRFQEGRSHMAIVSRFSMEKAASVKQVVKRGLTQRLLGKVGIGDSDDSPSESSEEDKDSAGNGSDGIRLRKRYRFRKKRGTKGKSTEDASSEDGETTLKSKEDAVAFDEAPTLESGNLTFDNGASGANNPANSERVNLGNRGAAQAGDNRKVVGETNNEAKKRGLSLPLKTMPGIGMISSLQLEQNMPADAVLSKEGAAEFLKNFDPAVMPFGIITLEDVLEELIGEEIYDEFDAQGAHGDPYEVPQVHIDPEKSEHQAKTFDEVNNILPGTDATRPTTPGRISFSGLQIPKPLRALDIFALRSHSAPPVPGSDGPAKLKAEDETAKTVETVLLTAQKATAHLAGGIRDGAALESGIEDVNNTFTPPMTFSPNDHLSSSALPQKQVGLALPSPGTGSARNTSASSLEAILLDRKRRMQAPGTIARTLAGPAARLPSVLPMPSIDGSIPVIPRPSSAPACKVKGTRFKSSRLGSLDLMGTTEQADDGTPEHDDDQDLRFEAEGSHE